MRKNKRGAGRMEKIYTGARETEPYLGAGGRKMAKIGREQEKR